LRILGIIPARFGSTRLEGKPLLDIRGKSMIHRVYEQCAKSNSIDKLIVATDSEKIADECRVHRMNFLMTSSMHNNGTERCAEVLSQQSEYFDLVINIQGDEPFISPNSIDEIASIFHQNPSAEIGTLMKKIENSKDISNPSIIKLTTNIAGKALYFSRSPIPFLRDIPIENWLQQHIYFKHIGMYAYRAETLLKIVNLEESTLEKMEKLEQLRWLENGHDIYVKETIYESKSIDTLEDYQYILENYSKYNNE